MQLIVGHLTHCPKKPLITACELEKQANGNYKMDLAFKMGSKSSSPEEANGIHLFLRNTLALHGFYVYSIYRDSEQGGTIETLARDRDAGPLPPQTTKTTPAGKELKFLPLPPNGKTELVGGEKNQTTIKQMKSIIKLAKTARGIKGMEPDNVSTPMVEPPSQEIIEGLKELETHKFKLSGHKTACDYIKIIEALEEAGALSIDVEKQEIRATDDLRLHKEFEFQWLYHEIPGLNEKIMEGKHWKAEGDKWFTRNEIIEMILHDGMGKGRVWVEKPEPAPAVKKLLESNVDRAKISYDHAASARHGPDGRAPEQQDFVTRTAPIDLTLTGLNLSRKQLQEIRESLEREEIRGRLQAIEKIEQALRQSQ